MDCECKGVLGWTMDLRGVFVWTVDVRVWCVRVDYGCKGCMDWM